MYTDLSQFFKTQHHYLNESVQQRVLIYMLFLLRSCQKLGVAFDDRRDFEGYLPHLFQAVYEYEIREASFTIDASMPWDVLNKNIQFNEALKNFCVSVSSQKCATSDWFLQQISNVFSLNSDIIHTPQSLCFLVSALSSQTASHEIIDLCCGTYSLGVAVWRSMKNSAIVCRGEEKNGYLCSFSRLFLFLCDVPHFFISEKDILTHSATSEQCGNFSKTYVADFPLSGSRTIPVSETSLSLKNDNISLYADWAMIQSVIERMNENDQAFLIVTKGALVRNNEKFLREELVKNDYLEAVIHLPSKLYFNHKFPVELMVLKKKKSPLKAKKILFVDVEAISSKSSPGTKQETIDEKKISIVSAVYKDFCASTSFSIVVSDKDIAAKNYSLLPSIYLNTLNSTSDCLALSKVSEVIRGMQSTASYETSDTGTQYILNVRDIQNGKINYASAEKIKSSKGYLDPKYKIREDDIIITSKGASVKIAIVPPDPPNAYICSNLTIVRVNPDMYSPYIVYEYLISEEGSLALELVQTGTTIKVLSKQSLEEFEIPRYDKSEHDIIGYELKCEAIKHSQAIKEIDESYAKRRKDLLANLK